MSDWFVEQLTRIGLRSVEAKSLSFAALDEKEVSILLVDDTPANLQVLQGTLKPLGHKLLAARDGESALSIARRSQPALVLLDVMMPGIDGYEVCRRMKADPELSHIAVIFCSALDDTKAKVRGLEFGAVDFITKPYEPDEIVARVNAHLAAQLLARSLAEKNTALARELAIARTQQADALRRVDWVLAGSSPQILRFKEQVAVAAQGDAPVFFRATDDTGAEAAVRVLHANSERRNGPLLTVLGGRSFDTPSASEISSFLPSGDKPSRLELAHGGILFVDQLDRLPVEALEDLASYIISSEETRRAGRTPVPDTRIVAVIGRDFGRTLPERVQFSMRVTRGTSNIEVPTLRDRDEDVMELAATIARTTLDSRGEEFSGFDDESTRRLRAHSWPGNLRELEDVIVRSVTRVDQGVVVVDPALLQSGIPLGSYRLLRRLGVGGFGEVWEARHHLLARPAAVKLILGDSASDPKVIERFRREATATAGLASPYTVTLYDFGISESGQFYYVMELLDGFDLEQLVMKHGALPAERLVHYLVHATLSLAEAHERGLIHRDIKPSNLFACRLGIEADVLKVLDFGLVRRQLSGAEAQLTQENSFVGTPAFMAPESAVGGELDGRADIYSLCATAYMLATGEPPFSGNTAMAILLAHMAQAPKAPCDVAPHIPQVLSDLILAGLAKAPADRPTAREFLSALRAIRLADKWDEEQRQSWWRQHRPDIGSSVDAEEPTSLTYFPS